MRGILIDKPVRSRGMAIGSSYDVPGRSPTGAASRAGNAATRSMATRHETVFRWRMAASAKNRLGASATCWAPSSRRGGGEDLDVLHVVVGVPQPRPHELQVGPHLALGEHLAELGDELARADVTLEDLQLVHIFLRGHPVIGLGPPEHLQIPRGDLAGPLQAR